MTATFVSEVPAGRDRLRDRRLVRAWLATVMLMIVAMIVVGGATRLTESGLSITEWKPIHGVIPPLSEAEWQEEFTKYQQIPQYQQLNRGMSLDGFRTIFWWEWAHRLLGRLIGLVFFVPLVGLWLIGAIERRLILPLVGLFLLGGLQGAIGWWMVASGLVDRVDVSQYRLATHLTVACIILAATAWIWRGLSPRAATFITVSPGLRRAAMAIVGLVFLQIFLGGLVAGLDAGHAWNTWPLLDGSLVPSRIYDGDPWWRSAFEDVMTVQFNHRMVAYLILVATALFAFAAWRSPARRGALHLLGVVLIQAVLGILTLVHVVPIGLALAHQFVAAGLLVTAVGFRRRMAPPTPITG